MQAWISSKDAPKSENENQVEEQQDSFHDLLDTHARTVRSVRQKSCFLPDEFRMSAAIDKLAENLRDALTVHSAACALLLTSIVVTATLVCCQYACLGLCLFPLVLYWCYSLSYITAPRGLAPRG